MPKQQQDLEYRKEEAKKGLVKVGQYAMGTVIVMGLVALAQLYLSENSKKQSSSQSNQEGRALPLDQLCGKLPREAKVIIDMLAKESDQKGGNLLVDEIAKCISTVAGESMPSSVQGREKALEIKVKHLLGQLEDDQSGLDRDINDKDGPFVKRLGTRKVNFEEAKKILKYQKMNRKLDSAVVKYMFGDDLVRATVGFGSYHPIFEQIQSDLKQVNTFPLTQIVSFGALADFRVWRMEIPSHVDYFDLETLEKSKLKISMLKELKAQLQMGKRNEASKFKLNCSYIPTVFDIGSDQWATRIQGMGFQKKKPTLFIAQNLLQTLEESMIKEFFKGINQVAASQSILFCNAPSQDSVVKLQEEVKQHSEFANQDDILKNFQWGYPQNPEKYFEGFGWKLYIIVNQHSMANAYGQGLGKLGLYDLHEQEFIVLIKS